jgi:glycosyltransferase involved in cell wall biosynthesis
MRALVELGHAVGLAAVVPSGSDALEGLRLDFNVTLKHQHISEPPSRSRLTRLQSRYASYFGASTRDMQAVAAAAGDFNADVLVGMGPDILPYMAATEGVRRVWYAGDEWVSHYCSVAKVLQPETWVNLRTAAIWGLYERAFMPLMERVWVVSPSEERAMRRWAGAARVDAIANGVDADYYAPQPVTERERAAVFWGRLDFSPNLQALQWFCRSVWPLLRERFPDASFRIIGFGAGDDARVLAQVPGVVLCPDLPDLRREVAEHGVVVLPFRSGGGIKNKLLEAAGMAKAIVCTPLACNGLRGRPPVLAVSAAQEWVDALARLWSNPVERRKLGIDAREWVLREHSWRRTASDAIASLTQ